MEEKNPTVSIIMPVYNQKEEYLQEAVNSIFTQTYTDWELIIVDDGSDDPVTFSGTNENVRVIRHETNKGIAAGLNTGIKNAKGKWISWLSSDDVWFPSKLEEQMKIASDKKQVVYSDWNYMDESGKDFQTTFEPEFKSLDELQRRLCHKFFACGSCILIHKNVFNDVGMFDEKYNEGFEDHEMWGRIAIKHMFYKVPKILMKYRTHPGALRNIANYEIGKQVRDSVRKLFNYEPKVSVVIIAHNEDTTIRACIEAIDKEDYIDEIIVVDDGSTNLVENFIDDKIKTLEGFKIIRNEKPIGRGPSRNKGFKIAKNYLVASCDGDIIPAPGWLKFLIDKMDERWLEATAASIQWIRPGNNMWDEYIEFYQTQEAKKSIGTALTLFRADILRELEYFDESMKSGEDSDLFMRMEQKGYKFIKFPEIMGVHYDNRPFWEYWKRVYQYGKDRAKAVNKHGEILKGQYSESEVQMNIEEMVSIIKQMNAFVGTMGFRDAWQKLKRGENID
jgi:glycosyltransferase involved in cell wall biosynthesis